MVGPLASNVKTAPLLVHRLARAACLVLMVHFAFTLAYAMPLNPVKLEYQKVLNRTIGTYFQQNWRLFAPDPLTETQSILVRCLNEDEGRKAIHSGDGKPLQLPSDLWDDVTGILWGRFQQRRLSAYDRLARPFTNASREFVSGGASAREWAESCQDGNQESCKIAEKFVQIGRFGAEQLLRKLGSA